MKTMLFRPTVLIFLASLLAAHAVAAEPETLSIKRYTKSGDILDIAQQKLIQKPKEQQSILGLLKLGQSDTAMLCLEKTDGGILGILGKADVVYADSSSLDQLRKLPAEKWDEAMAEFKPLTTAEATKSREEHPDKPRPRNPVAMAPKVLLVPLVDRPADVIACKTGGKIYLIQIVKFEKGGSEVELRLYPPN